MKRILSLLLILSIALSLTGCSRIKNKILSSEETTEPVTVSTIDVTIKPGWSITEIATALEEAEVCTASEFCSLCKTVPEGYSSLFGTDGAQANCLFAVEGYILPNTINFYQGKDASYALNRLLDNSVSSIEAISVEGKTVAARAEELGLSMHQVLTLASIIQYEANLGSSDESYETMQKVSSVFHNRLESTSFPYLGSDATRLYIENKCKDYIDANSLDYNTYFGRYCTNDSYTYKIKGLPVGPISSPTVEAIKAALWPADTNYTFFFTDSDGGFHFYTNYKDFNCEWNHIYKH